MIQIVNNNNQKRNKKTLKFVKTTSIYYCRHEKETITYKLKKGVIYSGNKYYIISKSSRQHQLTNSRILVRCLRIYTTARKCNFPPPSKNA